MLNFAIADVPVTSPVSATHSLSFLPNPATGTATIRFSNNSRSDVTLSLTNTLGQTVWSETLHNTEPGTHLHTVNCSVLPNGMYVLHLTTGNEHSVANVSIVK